MTFRRRRKHSSTTPKEWTYKSGELHIVRCVADYNPHDTFVVVGWFRCEVDGAGGANSDLLFRSVRGGLYQIPKRLVYWVEIVDDYRDVAL